MIQGEWTNDNVMLRSAILLRELVSNSGESEIQGKDV